MVSNLYKLYPQFQVTADRRQQDISVAENRRSGVERRTEQRPALPSDVKKDLYEVKTDFEKIYAAFKDYKNISKQATANFFEALATKQQKEVQKRELLTFILSPFPMARRLVNIKNNKEDNNPIKAVGLTAVAAINAKEDIRDLLSIADKVKISNMPKNGYAKYGFFVGTTVENWFNKSIKGHNFLSNVDRTIGESKFITNIFKIEVPILEYSKTVNHVFINNENLIRKCVKLDCPKPMKILLLTLYRMPVLSLLVSGLLELPAILKAKNKDKTKQLTNSTLNVVCGATTGALFSASAAIFLSAVPGSPIMALGVGYYLGSKIAKAIGFKLNSNN